MKKVIHFLRKSTLNQSVDHQENLLNETSKSNGWDVLCVISETISGSTKNDLRKGIQELKDFIKDNHVDLVCTWEISRISRSPREFHNLLSYLHERGVGLFIKNLNLYTLTDEGKENHITSLILTLMSEISKMETLTLRERVKVSLDNLKKKGVKLGRPVNSKLNKEDTLRKYPEIIKYLNKGLSLREVSRLSNTSINTTLKISKLLKSENN
jgi:DNA invertase Pin-like site-specific DNA recombinase